MKKKKKGLIGHTRWRKKGSAVWKNTGKNGRAGKRGGQRKRKKKIGVCDDVDRATRGWSVDPEILPEKRM